MDILGSLFDAVGDVCATSRKRVHFTSFDVPYAAVRYLEELGVRVWPGAAPHRNKDGSTDCTVQVRESQFKYAAGLLAGLPGVVVTSPAGVRPIKPRARWGARTRARGGINALLRALGGEVSAPLPPVKRKGKDKR